MSDIGSATGRDEFYQIFVKKYKIRKGDNPSAIDIFEKLSPEYDLYLGNLNIPVLEKLVEILSVQERLSKTLNKNSSILEVCCGTGLLGQCLRKAGFTGKLDGLDGSQGMIKQATKLENVYTELYTEKLRPDGNTSVPKRNYDVVISGHAFFPNSLDADHIGMLFDFLKVRGLFLFNLRYDIVEGMDKMMRYVATIEEKLDELTNGGKCKRMLVCDDDSISPRLNHELLQINRPKSEFVHERFYCYQKT